MLSTDVHKCEEHHGCVCSSTALDPSDDCFQHASGPWPPRCHICGKFLPWSVRTRALGEDTEDATDAAVLRELLADPQGKGRLVTGEELRDRLERWCQT